jgi:hypothetical protein
MEQARREAIIQKANQLFKTHQDQIFKRRKRRVKDNRYTTLIEAIQLYLGVADALPVEQRCVHCFT